MTFLGLSPELMDQLTSPLVLAPTLFTVALTSLYGYHWHLSYSKIGEAPIHWTWVPILGSAIAFGMEPIKYLQDNAEKYGDIFGLVLAGYRTFVIADSHSQGVVLKSNKNMTSENFHNSVVVNFFGASIHTMKCADYDLWRKWFMMHLYRYDAVTIATYITYKVALYCDF